MTSIKYRRNRSKKSVLESKFAAQKLAFAPISFQATRCLRDFGILAEIEKNNDQGISANEIAKNTNISLYGVETLLEVGANLDLVEVKNQKYFITNIGLFILNDEMTKINMDFVHDVCYQGLFNLDESIKNSKPEGLKIFGNWPTIYEGLSKLPKNVQKSWFSFDHFYSDAAFKEALPIVFKDRPKNLFDIGGNTGKWALECLNFDSDVHITIIDLPGQADMAQNNFKNLKLDHRISFFKTNILEEQNNFPKGANAIWMSQFLDCFSKEQITEILLKIANNVDDKCAIFILEPLWDQQKFPAATFSLNHTSLYFTALANGNSKMYRLDEIIECALKANLKLDQIFNDLGENDYSLLKFYKK